MNSETSHLSFFGGVQTVTGANFLLDTPNANILIDCGLNQDKNLCAECNYDNFPYDPKETDVLFVTHAHLDHIGRIPKLVRDGFHGIIYSTPATKDLATAMFEDAVSLLVDEAKTLMREPLYTDKDVMKALALWKTIPYHTPHTFVPDYSVFLKDAGHILGSAIVEITNTRTKKKIVFTGDLGNSPTPLLRDTDDVTDADYIVMESVYGDRNHEGGAEFRAKKFRDVVIGTIRRGGILMIPVFAIERTQLLLHELNHLVEENAIPSVPVFLDSPLAIKINDVYMDHLEDLNEHIQSDIQRGDSIFSFPKLQLTDTKQESKDIEKIHGPKIILAGAGMSYGGRIMFHEKLYLSDPKNTILFVGYQVPGTSGRQIQDGNTTVRIMGDDVRIRAHVETISGFSAHKDSEHLLEWVSKAEGKTKQVFVVMGEPKASLFLAQRIHDYMGIPSVVPKAGERFTIDF